MILDFSLTPKELLPLVKLIVGPIIKEVQKVGKTGVIISGTKF